MKMKAEEIMMTEDFRRCADFHGHICPGLSIGFQAAKVLLQRLAIQRAADEELVAVVETDACGVDAIQVLTGCTFGKGNLIHRNYGKHAFSLVDRKRGKTIRVCLRAEAFPPDPAHLSLLEKMAGGKASPEEAARFRDIHREKASKILQSAPESLFRIEEIHLPLPPKASILNSESCAFCGEPTKADLLVDIQGQKACIPCAEQKTGRPE
jgi:formylmethanofuran dehydrogenase subunit E